MPSKPCLWLKGPPEPKPVTVVRMMSGLVCAQAVEVERQRAQHPRRQVGDDDIGGRDQLADDLAAFRRGRVQGHPELVAVHREKHRAAAGRLRPARRRPGSCRGPRRRRSARCGSPRRRDRRAAPRRTARRCSARNRARGSLRAHQPRPAPLYQLAQAAPANAPIFARSEQAPVPPARSRCDLRTALAGSARRRRSGWCR